MTTAVQDIEEIQTGLAVKYPIVKPDGDIGKITRAVVIEVRDSGDLSLAEFIQAILARKDESLAIDGKIGPKTMAALAHLDELGDIESATTTPARDGERHVVKASSFADPKDVNAFRRCKTAGGSDMHCFKVGDNGIGARGANCAQDLVPMIALPREYWRHDGATIASPTEEGTLYVVTYKTIDLDCQLGDTMPALENIHNGAGMDTNPAVAKIFGLTPPYMVTMAYRKK